MNLVVDVGNSSTKLAVYKEGKRFFVSRINDLTCEELDKKLSGLEIKRAIISSVKELPQFITDLLTINIPDVHLLSFMSKLPFKIEYETPETLGSDRIAAVAGGYLYFNGDDILVIDAGTAVTYDYLLGKQYSGGNISPGINMRFNALHQYTEKLPLVEKSPGFESPGKNTNEAILAGVINGLVFEINEYIRTFKKERTKAKVILTGGDSGFLKEKISQRIHYMPDIVIDGLNYILEYNAK
jgi:type III pantothenate kinase